MYLTRQGYEFELYDRHGGCPKSGAYNRGYTFHLTLGSLILFPSLVDAICPIIRETLGIYSL